MDYLYSRQKFNLDQRAAESRAKDSDYTKSPKGASAWGTIPIISADKIFGANFLMSQQRAVNLLTDENQIRATLLSKLDEEARTVVEGTQSLKEMAQTMATLPEQWQAMIPAAYQGASIGDKTIIEGDQVTQISVPDLRAEIEKMQSQFELYTKPSELMPEGATDYLPPLQNISDNVQSILQAHTTQETVSIETIVTPLNNIATVVGNILTALNNRQPPQLTVSPTVSNNLGGAYVFDNAMKQELVNDITSNIVDEITTAVRQATSQSSFGYGS